jgi:cytochrome c553
VKRLAVYALLGGLAAALVVVSGLIPLKASSGHWAITQWLLDFTKRRSVATYSMGIAVPRLDDPALILRGAGHYDVGCRPCHGSPERQPPAIPARMLPPPPDLRKQAGRWTPAEQFTIVRHGIKFTGMPAWPAATRDDEVWAVVAFLQRLPALDAAGYDRLVLGDGPAAEAVPTRAGLVSAAAGRDPIADLARARCARCHGRDGRGREHAAFPRLAGQKPEYLRLALSAYASGARHSGTMTPIAAGLAGAEGQAIADHYAKLATAIDPPGPGIAPSSSGAARVSDGAGAPVGPGAEIATHGIRAQRVPRCVECHGPAATRRNPAYPRLAGQVAAYLEQQLQLFAEGRRGGSPYAHLMRDIAPRLTPAQRRDVAAWYASLSPAEAEIP